MPMMANFRARGCGRFLNTVMLRAGSCVLQPPGIKHREVRHSDDMELIEIISPADFHTEDETAP